MSRLEARFPQSQGLPKLLDPGKTDPAQDLAGPSSPAKPFNFWTFGG